MSDPKGGYGYSARKDPPSRVVPYGTPDPRVNAPPSSEPRKTALGVELARTGFEDYGGALVPSAKDALGRLATVFFAKSLPADPDNLDAVPDGLIYGRAVLTALLGGLIDFAGAGVVNKFAANLLRQPGGAALVDILAQLTDLGHAATGFEDAAGRQLRRFLAKTLPGDPDTFDGVGDGVNFKKQYPQLTIGLALVSATATTVTVLVIPVDPYGGTPTLTWDPTSGVTDHGDDTFTITRNAPGGGLRRVTFTATQTQRLAAVEAIDIPEQEGAGPDLDVRVATGASNSTITWGGDSVQLSIDGAAYGTPPSSPITVARNAAGGAYKEYTFRGSANGQSVTNTVTIPPIDADTVTPDITVIPATPGPTSQDFQVLASNPKPGGAAPTINVTPRGTSASVPGLGTIPDGDTAAISSGDVVTVLRPANGSPPGSVDFVASLPSGGSERVQRTVVPQGFGPSIEVSPTEFPTSVSIDWDAIGTVDYRIDTGSWTTPPASPFTVSRNTAGGDAKTVELRATLDGQTISTYVIVRPQDAGGGTVPPSIDAFVVDAFDQSANAIDLEWSASNVPGGATWSLYRANDHPDDDNDNVFVLVSASASSPFTDFPPLDIVPKGTSGAVLVRVDYELRLIESGVTLASRTCFVNVYATYVA